MSFAERHLTAAGPLEVAGRTIKRYYVSMAESPIDAQIVESARAFLPRLADRLLEPLTGGPRLPTGA